MSKYIVCKTNFTCAESIKEALQDIGVLPTQIQQSEAGIEMSGEGTGSKANIVVSEGTARIGFTKQDDGAYVIGMSSYVSHTAAGKKMLNESSGGTGELVKHYTKRVALRAAARNFGHKVKSCEAKNGKIQIKITVR